MSFAPPLERSFKPAFWQPASTANGLLNNLIAYWPLNEASGANNALDLHSNGLTLTQVSSPGADTGLVYATARTLDGSADYFVRNSEALLNVGNNDVTMAIWMYPTAAPAVTAGILTKWTGSLSWYWGFLPVRTINVQMSATGASASYSGSSTTALTLNVWSLVMWSYDYSANSVRLYINNGSDELNGTPSASGIFAGKTSIYLGTYNGSLYNFSGRIGPVMMWKSAPGAGGALTAAQRTALYNGGAGLAYAAFTT